jgi:hypothetical protein
MSKQSEVAVLRPSVLAPRGTILAAVGEARDNGIAGDVLQRIQSQRAANEQRPPPTPQQHKLG